jgi:hypothetical protein
MNFSIHQFIFRLKRTSFFYFILVFIFLLFHNNTFAQYSLGDAKLDATTLFAQTKQLTQFFRRFNGEEDVKGNKLDSSSLQYRNPHLRSEFISILFDNNNTSITNNLKSQFIKDVTNEQKSKYLSFRGNDWYAEVNAEFTYQNRPVNLLIYLELEQSGLGYKWVISNVYFDSFSQIFFHPKSSEKSLSFLHPMSHEIDFMNLRKAFADPKVIDYYAPNDYTPDYLTLFFVELKNGNLTYKTITSVKFHFLQIGGWYFEVNNFNRSGLNSGWLVSNILKISDSEKARLLKIYNHD